MCRKVFDEKLACWLVSETAVRQHCISTSCNIVSIILGDWINSQCPVCAHSLLYKLLKEKLFPQVFLPPFRFDFKQPVAKPKLI